MDFAPDNQTDNSLSNALNATFVTFNGNEGLLQNDMGNCRVESAYLPEGYIPVGTCEFGDIIYVVSYNPLKDKSQIGCFPSPERNLSSSEISNLKVSIAADEFIDTHQDEGVKAIATGKVAASQVKHIIYQNSLHAGDKFIISWGNDGLNNKSTISNVGNTFESLKETEQYWPKLLRVHVVSIEDDGKMTYLDDSVKWYGSDENDFVISTATLTNNDRTEKGNIDDYRHALQSNYSVFQSKVPGKLALLLELEKITGFSCGHKSFIREENDGTYYDLYLSIGWDTDNYNINPCGLIITAANENLVTLIDDGSSKLKPGLNSEISKYSYKRVIDISRIYKQEDPGRSYLEFNGGTDKDGHTYTGLSYYRNLDSYLVDDSNEIVTSVIRIYSGNRPKDEDSLYRSAYYCNPVSVTHESIEDVPMTIQKYVQNYDSNVGTWEKKTYNEDVTKLLKSMYDSNQEDGAVTFYFSKDTPTKINKTPKVGWPEKYWSTSNYDQYDKDIYYNTSDDSVWEWTFESFAGLYKSKNTGVFDKSTWEAKDLSGALKTYLDSLSASKTTIKIWYGIKNPEPQSETNRPNWPAEDWDIPTNHIGEYYCHIETATFWVGVPSYAGTTKIFKWEKAEDLQINGIKALIGDICSKTPNTSEEVVIYTSDPGNVTQAGVYYYNANDSDGYWKNIEVPTVYQELAKDMYKGEQSEVNIFTGAPINKKAGDIWLTIPNTATYYNKSGKECTPVTIPDDVVINTFKKSVLKKIGTVKKNTATETSMGNSYYEYTVCPCMPYGVLEEFAITNTIKFDKIQTGEVNISTWQYYVNTTSMYLTFGFDTYLKEDENEVIEKIVMEFYDDLGLCATYELKEQESYEAKFTEYFSLDSVTYNSRFLDKTFTTAPKSDEYLDRTLTTQIYHKNPLYVDLKFEDIVELSDEEFSKYFYNAGTEEKPEYKTVTKYLQPEEKVYLNDSGILYYGRPYIVKIMIFKGRLDELGTIDPTDYLVPITYYRWMWTGPVFNDNYGLVSDFSSLQIEATLDYDISFNAQTLKEQHYNYYLPFHRYSEDESWPDSWKSLGAEITAINFRDCSTGEGDADQDIKTIGLPKLADTYGMTVALMNDSTVQDRYSISMGVNNLRITNTSSEISCIYEEGTYNTNVLEIHPVLHPSLDPVITDSESKKSANWDEITSKYSSTLLKLLQLNKATENEDIYDSESAYKNYEDWFNLQIIADGITPEEQIIAYYDADGTSQSGKIKMYSFTAKDWYSETWGSPISLRLQGIRFNKVRSFTYAQNQISKILAPIVESKTDLQKYGISLTELGSISGNYPTGTPYFENSLHIVVADREGINGEYATVCLEFSENVYAETQKPSDEKANISPRGVNYIAKTNIKDWLKLYLLSPETQEYLLANSKSSPFVSCSFGFGNVSNTPLRGIDLNSAFNPKEKLTEYFGPQRLSDISKETIEWGQLPRATGGSTNLWPSGEHGKKTEGQDIWHMEPGTTIDYGPIDLNIPVTLGIRDDEKLYVLGDWFLSKEIHDHTEKQVTNKDWLCYQAFYWNPDSEEGQKWKEETTGDICNFAQLIGSLFCQLFVTKDKEGIYYFPKNLIKLSDNSEQWKADIVVNLTPKNTIVDTLEDNSTSALIVLFKIHSSTEKETCPLKYYAQKALIMAGLATGTIDDAARTVDNFIYDYKKLSVLNINPNLPGILKPTEFNFAVTYSVDSISDIYITDNSCIPYRLLDGTSGMCNISSNTADIYTHMGDNNFIQFKPNINDIKLVETFNTDNTFTPVYAKLKNGEFAKVLLNSKSNLDQVLYWNGSQVSVHNIDKLQDISRYSTLFYNLRGDDQYIKQISTAHIFDYIHA